MTNLVNFFLAGYSASDLFVLLLKLIDVVMSVALFVNYSEIANGI